MTSYTPAELALQHKRSTKNQDAVMSASQVGCFYCLAVYPSVEITEFIENSPCGDAVCPKCSTDAVIVDDGVHEFTPELLKALHKHYF